jgi:hypothetical protein
MIEIILESFNSLFKAIDIFLSTRDLTLGAILAGVSPFVVIWYKISREKEKKARSLLIERRQLQIAFNVNELLEALKVESKWSLQEITSSHEDPQSSKKSFLLSRVVTILRRKKFMGKLKSRKFWLTIAAALIPVINKEFNINLDLGSIVAIMTAIMSGVAALAHVDAKKVIASIAKTPPNVLADMTFKEAIPIIQTVHNGINNLLKDAKLNDGSQAFKDAVQAYSIIMSIIEANKHPEPLPTIPDEQVSA